MPRIASRAPACQCQWLHTACQRQLPVAHHELVSTLQPFGTKRQSGRRQRIGPGGLLAAARTCAVAAGALLGSLLQLLKRDLCLLNAGCSRWQHGNAPARARGPGTRRAPPPVERPAPWVPAARKRFTRPRRVRWGARARGHTEDRPPRMGRSDTRDRVWT